jgi:hypothetical protein
MAGRTPFPSEHGESGERCLRVPARHALAVPLAAGKAGRLSMVSANSNRALVTFTEEEVLGGEQHGRSSPSRHVIRKFGGVGARVSGPLVTLASP